MVRLAVLTIALLFTALLGAVTLLELVRDGVSALAVVSLLIVALFTTGIVGALRHPRD
ncbi:MAG: hypothetical protein ABSG43_20300 [Solirubrobacteraceae bacterium]